MQTIKILWVSLLVTIFLNGCSHYSNSSNDEIYKKAVVKLVKDESKKVYINKNIIDYIGEEK